MLIHSHFGPEHKFHFVGVFDGHGGDCVSKELPRLFAKEADRFYHGGVMETMAKKYTRAFASIEKYWANKPVRRCGSTATVAEIRYEDQYSAWGIHIANLGDSRAVVFNLTDGKVRSFTEDHKPYFWRELQRIEALGGFVREDDGNVARVQGVLATSRAFGDLDLQPYVSSEPDIGFGEWYGPGVGLLLATDGLFDVMWNEEVAELAVTLKLQGKTPQEIAKELCQVAYDLGSTDNISVIYAELL